MNNAYSKYMKGNVLNILFGKETIEELEVRRIKLGVVSKSDVVRMAVREFLDKESERKQG